MAANRPRIAFTPEPDTLRAIDRLAKFRCVPMATVVAEYMALITPALDEVGEALAEAHAAEQEARERAIGIANDVHSPVVEVSQRTAHMFRAMLDRAGSAEPPSSNTGVTTSDDSPPPSPVRR